MSNRYITADWIYPVASSRIENGVVVVNKDRIVNLMTRDQVPADQLEYYKGIIVPGFVNTHCHSELSHLKGKADSGTGLLSFINHVVRHRNVDAGVIQDAIRAADKEMWDGGIQVVGDICNTADSFQIKKASPIKYYSFIEMFDFLQDEQMVDRTKQYLEVYEKRTGNGAVVPHAPYSVSPSLFRRINLMNTDMVTVSIHNQETQDEDELFRNGKGDFYSFYKSFDIDLSAFNPTGKSSIYYAMEHMDTSKRALFVHNTFTTAEDIQAAKKWNPEVYWATCPNANLYIENRLPHYQTFIDNEAIMTIGTDSLSSNWQLSILEEMKTIARYQSAISFDTLLQWATLNGARALGLSDTYGSFEKGKAPGILHLSFDPEKDAFIDDHVQVTRIV